VTKHLFIVASLFCLIFASQSFAEDAVQAKPQKSVQTKIKKTRA